MGELVLRSDGIREMLRSAELADVCLQHAESTAAGLGSGYEVSEPYYGQNRVNVSIRATSKEAIKDNLDNNTLMKAVE